VAIEGEREDGVRVVDRRRAPQAEFGCESALEGAPQPLDPALRLGAAGADPADLEIVEGASDLGERALAGQLLGDGGCPGGSWTKIPWRSE
jgi:hypothetical protein